MSGTLHALHSTTWYRVANLRPRLRRHVRIHRHHYRGTAWYIVEDRYSNRFHRFNTAVYRLLQLMDGRRSLQSIWDHLAEEGLEDLPEQEQVVQLLGQLHAAELILCNVTPDVAELFERHGKEMRRRLWSRFANPLSLRFPLVDPDRCLDSMVRSFAGLWGTLGAILWLAVVVMALALVPSHWPDLSQNFSERVLAGQNVVLMALVFPILKVIHEFGHGIAVKSRGGEVHEAGVMLLVLYPIPYVDASAASGFGRKRDRILVGAAGVLIEIFVAAIAFLLWLAMEPGVARSIAYNVIVLASVTTVLFNANPLLRYDGYYVLCDWAEIPNLGARATHYWRYLLDRYVIGLPHVEQPVAARGEKAWFLSYAPIAFCYRLSVTFAIALFVSQQFMVFGVMLAIWGVAASFYPAAQGLYGLLTAPQYAERSIRVHCALGSLLALVLVALFVLPLPLSTSAEGIVDLPEQAVLRAEGTGFISQIAATPGMPIKPGQLIAESYDPELGARVAWQTGRVEELQAKFDALWRDDPTQAGFIHEELERERAALHRVEEETARLALHARSDGVLQMQDPGDLPGRLLKKGELIGYLVGAHTPIVRVVVPQYQVDFVRHATESISVRLVHDFGHPVYGRVVREVPLAGRDLPSPALGQQGGGEIELDPREPHGNKAIASLFEFDVSLPTAAGAAFLGARAYVRFEHPAEPFGFRVWRSARRLFLSHFNV